MSQIAPFDIMGLYRKMFGQMPIGQANQIMNPVKKIPKKRVVSKSHGNKLHNKLKNRRKMIKNSRRMNRS